MGVDQWVAPQVEEHLALDIYTYQGKLLRSEEVDLVEGNSSCFLLSQVTIGDACLQVIVMLSNGDLGIDRPLVFVVLDIDLRFIIHRISIVLHDE